MLPSCFMLLKGNFGGKNVLYKESLIENEWVQIADVLLLHKYFNVFASVILYFHLFFHMLFEEPETRAVTQNKPYAGNTQNSSVLNALTSDPLLGFVQQQKKSSVLAVMRLGLWFICGERHVNRQESRQTDSDSTRGDSSLQKDNNSWRRGTCNERECFRTSCSMAFHYSKVLYFTHSSSLQHDTFVLENMSLR